MLKQMNGGSCPVTKNVTNAVSGKLIYTGLTFAKGYSVTITANATTANPACCTSLAEECGNFSGGSQARVNNSQTVNVTDQEIFLNSRNLK